MKEKKETFKHNSSKSKPKSSNAVRLTKLRGKKEEINFIEGKSITGATYKVEAIDNSILPWHSPYEQSVSDIEVKKNWEYVLSNSKAWEGGSIG